MLTLVPDLVFSETNMDIGPTGPWTGRITFEATSGNLTGDLLTLNGVKNINYYHDFELKGENFKSEGKISLVQMIEYWPLFIDQKSYNKWSGKMSEKKEKTPKPCPELAEIEEVYGGRSVFVPIIRKQKKEINPNDAVSYYNRGVAKFQQAHRQQEDYGGAIQDYNKAIELNPNLADAYNNRGVAKFLQKDDGGAIQDYNKAIELNPNLAYAYNNRGIAKDHQNGHGAIQDYNKAIELNPNLVEAYGNRANHKNQQMDFKGSRQDQDKYSEISNKCSTFSDSPSIDPLIDSKIGTFYIGSQNVGTEITLKEVVLTNFNRLKESCPELTELIKKSEKMEKTGDKTLTDDINSLAEKCKKDFPDLFEEVIRFRVERTNDSPTTVQKFGAARLHIDINLEAVCGFIYLMGSHRTQSNVDLANIMCSGLQK